MTCARLAGPAFLLLITAVPAWAAGDPRIEQFALCRESWLDLEKSDPAALESFGEHFRSEFTHDSEGDGHLTPKSPVTVSGLTVTQVYPASLGMGLGFSVIVDAPFDVARQALERDLGQSLGGCEAGDGMQSCELPVAEKRTVVLMAEDTPRDHTTLIGCYYYYEK
jgi:hypothetical protein